MKSYHVEILSINRYYYYYYLLSCKRLHRKKAKDTRRGNNSAFSPNPTTCPCIILSVFSFTRDWRCDQDIHNGRFPFNKNSGLKFRKFSVFNGTVHSGSTDPTQATARLVIVLASRIQKSGTGDNNFVKWKGTFRSDRPKWPDRSKRTTFKAGPEYSGRTKPKWSVPFDVPTEFTGILGWMESAQLFTLDWRCAHWDR